MTFNSWTVISSIDELSGVCAKGAQRDLPSAPSLITETKAPASPSPVDAAPHATETAVKRKAAKKRSIVSGERAQSPKRLKASKTAPAEDAWRYKSLHSATRYTGFLARWTLGRHRMTSNQPSDPSTRPNEPTAPLPSRERVSSWGLCALKAIFLCCLTTLLSVSMVSTRRSAGSKPLHSNVHPAKHSHSRKVVPDLRRSRHPDSKARPKDERRAESRTTMISLWQVAKRTEMIWRLMTKQLLAPSARPDFSRHLHTHTVNTDVPPDQPYMFNEGMTATAPTHVLVQMPSADPSRRVFVTEVDRISSIIGSVDESNKGGAQVTLDVGVPLAGHGTAGMVKTMTTLIDKDGTIIATRKRARENPGVDMLGKRLRRCNVPYRCPASEEWDGGSGGESDSPGRQGWHDHSDEEEGKGESRRGHAVSEGDDARFEADDEADDGDADARFHIDVPRAGNGTAGVMERMTALADNGGTIIVTRKRDVHPAASPPEAFQRTMLRTTSHSQSM
ncbi:hypothetical protein IMY05_C1151001900 [Salix suchowensis]|nr:hypothetical protein IMY05_C1151001900 [Salix suchowensis]